MVPPQRPYMNDEQIQALYMDILLEEGFRPKADDEGDLVFKSEGRSVFIRIDPGDTEFLMLCCPNIWKCDSEEEEIRCLAAASYATASTKVAKVSIVGEYAWASVELFLPAPEHFRSLLIRSLGAMHAAIRNFVDKMDEFQKEDEPFKSGD
jgi:hypothetical protein